MLYSSKNSTAESVVTIAWQMSPCSSIPGKTRLTHRGRDRFKRRAPVFDAALLRPILASPAFADRTGHPHPLLREERGLSVKLSARGERPAAGPPTAGRHGVAPGRSPGKWACGCPWWVLEPISPLSEGARPCTPREGGPENAPLLRVPFDDQRPSPATKCPLLILLISAVSPPGSARRSPSFRPYEVLCARLLK